MVVDFEEKEHVYSVNGEIASVSVTELLTKHGLAPNYKGANKTLLKSKAEEGKKIHKDLENILNKADYEPTTPQGLNFKKWVKDNIDCGVGEQVLAYEKDGLIIAGTADVMAIGKNGELIIADHKNTSKFHKEYVSWQVSLLDYFARMLGNEKINGKTINWKGATKFIGLHYDTKTGELTPYELEKIDDKEIEKLLECEYKNEKYQRPVLVIDKALEESFVQAEALLISLEEAKKKAEVSAKEIREQILKLFEEQGIKSWESADKSVKVTYVAPIDQIRVDSAKLKKEFPQVYSKCQKLTKTAAQIRVKVRGGEDFED